MSLNNWSEYRTVVNNLSTAIKNGIISHSYIIEADSCVDKLKFAKDFLKAVMCQVDTGNGCDDCIICNKIQHDNMEDLYFIEADGNSVKDGQISKLQEKLKKIPIGCDRNLAIIQNADTMTIRAQNRFLKTLEEPAVGTIILLLSENTENLLDTIKSRSIKIRLNSAMIDMNNENVILAEKLIDLIVSNKGYHELFNFESKEIKDRSRGYGLLDGLERLFRDYLINDSENSKFFKKEEIITIIRSIEEARRDLNMNVNFNYAIKNLIIKIGG